MPAVTRTTSSRPSRRWTKRASSRASAVAWRPWAPVSGGGDTRANQRPAASTAAAAAAAVMVRPQLPRLRSAGRWASPTMRRRNRASASFENVAVGVDWSALRKSRSSRRRAVQCGHPATCSRNASSSWPSNSSSRGPQVQGSVGGVMSSPPWRAGGAGGRRAGAGIRSRPGCRARPPPRCTAPPRSRRVRRLCEACR